MTEATSPRRYYYRHPCGCIQVFENTHDVSHGLHTEPPEGARVVQLEPEHKAQWYPHTAAGRCPTGRPLLPPEPTP